MQPKQLCCIASGHGRADCLAQLGLDLAWVAVLVAAAALPPLHVRLELLRLPLRRVDELDWQVGEPRYVEAVALRARALLQLVEEGDLGARGTRRKLTLRK